jgi:GT2 family glycosyltransferase
VGSGQWGYRVPLPPPHSPLLTPHPVWGASATAAFYRRDALLRAGGFPPDFGAYFEDVDLSFRLRRLGCDIWFEPASVVWHRGSASYGRRPGRRVLERQSCNEERVFWRNPAVLVGKALRRLEEGTFGPWCSGRLRALVLGLRHVRQTKTDK